MPATGTPAGRSDPRHLAGAARRGESRFSSFSRIEAFFLHDSLTVPAVPCRSFRGGPTVDVIFIITVVALYAVTHWIVRALSRLGGLE
jgi:hypothetical protein